MITNAQREAVAKVLYEGHTGNAWEHADILGYDRERYYRHADEIIAAYEAAGAAPTHRHRKGGLYRLIGCAMDADFLHERTVYRSVATGQLWACRRAEFEDGRFTLIEPKGKP